MISWLFKKGISKHIKRELTPMNKALENSFIKIKEEFLHVHKRVDDHHHNHNKILQKLEQIELRLLNIEQKSTKSFEDEEEFDSKPSESEWNSLTALQKNLLEIMAKLHEEGAKSWIPLKQLVEERYPDKDYEDVRPLISSYISLLVEYNMIKKKRIGKQAFISLTKKSFTYLRGDLKTKKLLKVIKESD